MSGEDTAWSVAGRWKKQRGSRDDTPSFGRIFASFPSLMYFFPIN
jgi:hypothetical protein